MEERKLLNLIREAIKLEVNGRKFFIHAADATTNELGKKMFKKLAEEEVKHLETFSHLFSAMTGSEDWKKSLRAEDLEEDSAVIHDLAARMKKAEGQSEIEALRIGMELEQKAVKFFKDSGDGIADQKIRDIFDKICEEENFHYDLLQAQYDTVMQDGFWFDTSEFQMDGKY